MLFIRTVTFVSTPLREPISWHEAPSGVPLVCVVDMFRIVFAIASVIFPILLTPFFFFILSIVFLGSVGKSIGIRRAYVKLLVKVFEVSCQLYVLAFSFVLFMNYLVNVKSDKCNRLRL